MAKHAGKAGKSYSVERVAHMASIDAPVALSMTGNLTALRAPLFLHRPGNNWRQIAEIPSEPGRVINPGQTRGLASSEL